ncbi:MAG: class I SAM-dependent methyltransferase [Candidatus Hodarchaeales archaeon]
MTLEAESHVNITSETSILSIACGTGEIELYLAEKYGCNIKAIDLSERFIEKAQVKSFERKLHHLVKFRVGDGSKLNYDSNSFDLVYCSGAICEFYYNGIREIHRVLKPKGQVIIIEVVWDSSSVPFNVREVWEGDTATILSKEENDETFQDYGFEVIFSSKYHEPEWWMNYYKDRGEGLHWKREKSNYMVHKNHIQLGLFVLMKK